VKLSTLNPPRIAKRGLQIQGVTMRQENAVGWFELPVADMDRAVAFYERVLGAKLHRVLLGDLEMAWFPAVEGAPGASGALAQHPRHYRPSVDGALLYFNSPSGSLSQELGRVEDAGGEILIPRRQISEEHGYMAVFQDSEGNRVALRSMA
jgi:uncharacterized protein